MWVPTHPGGVRQRRERRCWSVCASRIPSRMPRALGEGLREGMAVALLQSPNVKAGTPCSKVNAVKAGQSQHVSSLGGNELSAIQRCMYPFLCREETCSWGCGVLPGALNPECTCGALQPGVQLRSAACRWAPARQREPVPPSLAPSPPSTALNIRSCHTITTVRWSVLLS